MARSTENDDTTPDNSEPMIIDGEVVYGNSAAKARQESIDAEIVEAELVDEDDADLDDAPPERVRNGMANAGMLLGIASLIMNPFGVSSIAAIIVSFIGLRRSVALFKAGEPPVGRIPATIGLAFGVATAIFAAWIIITNPTAA
ncbi:hypothetical protein [Demequina aurantiaca]|uniref:hypothetical protein n=1 Tax=Demequina aurantiaca TaxID=676200 RepID=UPI003D355A63